MNAQYGVIIKGSFEERKYDNSYESLITPYEDMNIQQQRITGERFPDIGYLKSQWALMRYCIWNSIIDAGLALFLTEKVLRDDTI
jgi:hypothetical protein